MHDMLFAGSSIVHVQLTSQGHAFPTQAVNDEGAKCVAHQIDSCPTAVQQPVNRQDYCKICREAIQRYCLHESQCDYPSECAYCPG